MFKSKEFSVWLKDNHQIDIEDFAKMEDKERRVYLQEFMDTKPEVKAWTFTTKELLEFIEDMNVLI